MPRLSSKDIREQIDEKLTENQALAKLADDEDRDLTPDEQKLFDENLAAIGQPSKDGQPATGLYEQLERSGRFEQCLGEFRNRRTGEPPRSPGGGESVAAGAPDENPRNVIVPVNQYRHGSLRAFRGQHAERDAYVAGQFLAATIFRNERSAQWCQEHGVDTRFYGALSGDDNSLGGFLVPSEMEQAIINLRESYGEFRRECRVVPMGSDTKDIPRRTSGLTAYFAGDNESMTASDKAWDAVSLTAKKLYALCKYSSELNEDSIISIGDDLTEEIAYAFANKEDECGFNGDGTSTYGGIVGVLNAMAAGSIYDAATGNTAFSSLDLADFEGVVGQLPQYASPNAKWYISRAGFYASAARLMNAGGGNTTETLADGTRRMVFLGYPVVFTQVLNSTLTAQASTVIAAFGDLRMGAVLGNRRGMSIMISEHRYFEYDQLAIRGTERFDINVHETGDASNAGALIVLKTPSS